MLSAGLGLEHQQDPKTLSCQGWLSGSLISLTSEEGNEIHLLLSQDHHEDMSTNGKAAWEVLGHGNPRLYSCLGNSTDRGAWWAQSVESPMTEVTQYSRMKK